jgi:DNA-binding IclR family transcriptional regulator
LSRFTDTTICDAAALRRELESIRRRGVAFDDNEHELGIFCVGAAVLDRAGRCVAGISVAGSSVRLKPEAAAVADLVRAAAREISAKL